MRNIISKFLILSAFLLGITFHANAQGTGVTLVVTTTDGVEQSYQLTEESQLYFENGERLVIEDGTGNTMSFQLADIKKLVCTEVTGIGESTASALQLIPNPARDSFIIKNLQGNTQARIYALDGRLMKLFEATEGMMVDISGLAKGMYLLHIDGQTLKMTKQ